MTFFREMQNFFRKMPKRGHSAKKSYDLQKQKLDSAKIWSPVSEVLDPLVITRMNIVNIDRISKLHYRNCLTSELHHELLLRDFIYSYFTLRSVRIPATPGLGTPSVK